MTGTVLLLATLATKADEAAYLTRRLTDHGATVRTIDISLETGGKTLGGSDKIAAMQATVARVWDDVAAAVETNTDVTIGIGGGTGGEVILQVLRALPVTFPKLLVTTLPFDPRGAIADNSIILVPTLADICGLNATLRQVLDNTAAMTVGLCSSTRTHDADPPVSSVGITAMGATEAAVAPLVKRLGQRGQETTVFHSNGYGGAAFTRFANQGAFHAIIDLTPHELTRLELTGDHVPMAGRFTSAGALPRIVLPGGLNFLGLGAAALVPSNYLQRPHYAHSTYFTHAKLNPDEMTQMASKLIDALNNATGPRALIVPMGGFSHQDCLGGAIEDPELRQIFLDVARSKLKAEITIHIMPGHISAPAVTDKIITVLKTLTLDQFL